MIGLIFLRVITIVLFILLGITFVISLICLISKSFRDKFNSKVYNPLNRSGLKEIVSVITFLFTIASIFFAITTYYEGVQIQKENDKIILSNLVTEIKVNLDFIDYFELNKQQFIETDMFTSDRLHTFYLEKSADIIKDRSVREKIIQTIADMKVTNTLIGQFSDIYVPQGEIIDTGYKKIKKEAIGSISQNNLIIKSRLTSIQEKI